MPELPRLKRLDGDHDHSDDPALVRAELVRARHHFEQAAEAVRQDFEALRGSVWWRVLFRSRPIASFAVGVIAGLAVGFWLGGRRRG